LEYTILDVNAHKTGTQLYLLDDDFVYLGTHWIHSGAGAGAEHRTNQSVRDEIVAAIGPPEHLPMFISAMVKRRKVTWYGHVNRSDGLATTMMQGTVEGGRKRGRPKTRWLYNITRWTRESAEAIHKASYYRTR